MESRQLTEGNITRALVKLAIPIMATSFVQMAYNLTDMLWLGRVGTKAVAASGTAGFFTWFGSALFMIPKIGAEVGVAQSIGRKDMEAAKKYVSNTIKLDILIALVYSAILIAFRHEIIGFFQLGDQAVIQMSVDYLLIVSFGLVFYFLNPVFSGVFNGYGDSSTPFKINAVGLITNMILDPLMIMGIGPFPKMGVKGAALATIIAQFIVTLIFVIASKRKSVLFKGPNILKIPFDRAYVKTILKLGLPVAIQQGLFSSIAMVIARIIAQWGPVPVAVQKVGSQIESISWMTAGGFQTAMSAFAGQNFGAKKWARVIKGYLIGLGIMAVFGLFASGLLIFAGKPIFSVFIAEKETIQYGVTYLKILGLSQLFMCTEAVTAGAFNGLGKTIPPSVTSISLNALRIPTALILSSSSLGLNGVWWAISISSILKGSLLPLWYIIMLKRNSDTKHIKISSLIFNKSTAVNIS